jgi:proteic killer suppression protein
MIVSFRHKGLEELYLKGETRRIGADYVRKCVRVLQMLASATRPDDMHIAGFRFHGLHGKPPRWSVCVTGNYRVTFGWLDDSAVEVDLEDYH